MSSGGHGYILESDASVRFIVTDTAVALCHYSAHFDVTTRVATGGQE